MSTHGIRAKGDPSFVADTKQYLGKGFLQPASSIFRVIGLGGKEVNTKKVGEEAERRFAHPVTLSPASNFVSRVLVLTALAGVAYGLYSTGMIGQLTQGIAHTTGSVTAQAGALAQGMVDTVKVIAEYAWNMPTWNF